MISHYCTLLLLVVGTVSKSTGRVRLWAPWSPHYWESSWQLAQFTRWSKGWSFRAIPISGGCIGNGGWNVYLLGDFKNFHYNFSVRKGRTEQVPTLAKQLQKIGIGNITSSELLQRTSVDMVSFGSPQFADFDSQSSAFYATRVGLMNC